MEAKLHSIREAHLQQLEAELEVLYQSNLIDIFRDHPSTWLEKAAHEGSRICSSRLNKDGTWNAYVDYNALMLFLKNEHLLCKKYNKWSPRKTDVRNKRIQRILETSFGIHCEVNIDAEKVYNDMTYQHACLIKVPDSAFQQGNKNVAAVAKTVTELLKAELDVCGPTMISRCEKILLRSATEGHNDHATVSLEELDAFFQTLVHRVNERHPDILEKNASPSECDRVRDEAIQQVSEFLQIALGFRITVTTYNGDKTVNFSW
jgi:hypothetical protein